MVIRHIVNFRHNSQTKVIIYLNLKIFRVEQGISLVLPIN